MEDFASLFQKEAYESILKLSENSADSNALFYRSASFLALKRVKEAYLCLKENRTLLFEAKPELLLKYNFETLFLLGDFDTAYEDLKYFENLPYVSQQVEEILRALPKRIRQEEIQAYKNLSFKEDDLVELLKSNENKSPETLMGILGKATNISPEGEAEKEIEKLLTSDYPHYLKSFALMQLVNAKVNHPVRFLNHQEEIEVVPNSIKLPFEYPEYQQVLKELSLVSMKEPSIQNAAKSIYEQYALELYPSHNENIDPPTFACALFQLASNYLRSNSSTDLYQSQHHLDSDQIQKEKEEIENTLKASLE